MNISNNYIAVEKLEEPTKGGFQTVEVQDSSIFKGKVKFVPEAPIFMGNKQVTIGDTILFAKYSPNTHDIEDEGLKLKFVKTEDVLAVL